MLLVLRFAEELSVTSPEARSHYRPRAAWLSPGVGEPHPTRSSKQLGPGARVLQAEPDQEKR
jgi:hypothetical protein